MEIKIQKVKLVKRETLEISYVKTEADNSKTDVSEKHKTEVHKDLKDAFADLSIHLAVIAGFIEPKQIDDIEKVDPSLCEDFHVSAYSIGGDEDDEGVVLTGHKVLKNGKALIMNTPFTRFNEAEESAYRFIDDLQTKIGIIEEEVIKYLTEGKKAEDPQGELDFSEPVTKIQLASPESEEEQNEEMLKQLKETAPAKKKNNKKLEAVK